MRDGDGLQIAILFAIICSLLAGLANCALEAKGPVPVCADCMTAW